LDYQILRRYEVGFNELNKNLREIGKDNPESGCAMTEEQLHKFEQSGAGPSSEVDGVKAPRNAG